MLAVHTGLPLDPLPGAFDPTTKMKRVKNSFMKATDEVDGKIKND